MTCKIYDITLPITPDVSVWPGDPPVELTRAEDMAQGADANVTRLALSAHAGTHVDAPVHFLPGGAGVEALDLTVLTGPALVVHLPEADAIDAPLLKGLHIPAGTERLLF